jgi:hypothetical protein
MDTTRAQVLSASGKGVGVFALLDMPQGTEIFSEEALISIEAIPVSEKQVEEEVGKLADAESARFYALTSKPPPYTSLPHAIYMNNAFTRTQHTELFVGISRINHSCIPNATFIFHPHTNRGTVRLVKDIKKGQEITISYLAPDGISQTYEERKNDLEENWNFDCRCEACGADAEAKEKSDKRRRALKPLCEKLLQSTKLTLQEARVLVFLMDQEKLYTKETGDGYYNAAVGEEENGNFEEALRLAENALKIAEFCLGKGSLEATNLVSSPSIVFSRVSLQ